MTGEWDHRAHDCPQPCLVPRCQFCEGGLFLCTKCGSFEGATTTHCPGVQMSPEEIDAVYAGYLDYVRGEWLSGVTSMASPRYWRLCEGRLWGPRPYQGLQHPKAWDQSDGLPKRVVERNREALEILKPHDE